ncbi:RDD family protein [Cellulomonas cellasea]|uniref:Putative RDD family membrane protein YckC n=1 Tax=Cellulomonas cellasea TaxID=43670 RepID=A0A7W4UE23_9CELL|nr:RDD family protein [Cellulomonas cellasea]MBB2922483.1 putative RDD family membrane protein YckC [Cellulomonas cellasea]
MSTVPRVRAQPPATESLAGTGRRVLALLVDQLVALLLAAGASSLGYGLALDAVRSSPGDEVAPEVGAILALPLAVLAVVGVLQWVAEAFTGRTLGGLALGVRTVDADTGLTVGLVRIFVRNVVLGVGSLVCGVGQFVVGASGAWDSAGRLQGWHDRVARTVVVRAGAGSTATRAPRPEPGRRTAETGPAVPTSSAAALRRAPGSGGADSLMRAARAGASAGADPVATSVPGVTRPEDVRGADDTAYAGDASDALDAQPSSGSLRRAAPPAPAAVTAAAVAPEAAPEPVATINVPTWSTPAAATPAPAPSDVITAAPSWAGASAPPVTADAPLDPHAPTAPTRRLRKAAPPAEREPVDAPPAAEQTGAGTSAAEPPASEPAATGPAATAPTAAPGPGAPRGIRLVFDTGEAFAVVGRGVVGRNPSTADSGVVSHVVPIDDPARSVSKTHLEFGTDHEGLWVLDRRSTNGSVLVHADGTRERIIAGVRTGVPVGAVVEFGDRRFQVLDA